MTVAVLEGPEAAGKTSIIGALREFHGGRLNVREWSGPARPNWTEYVEPFYRDWQAPDLWVWSRGWASEVVYNELLKRGQHIDTAIVSAVLENGGLDSRLGRFMVLADPAVLGKRRHQRKEEGGKPDLDLDPEQEWAAFFMYAKTRNWTFLDGRSSPQFNAKIVVGEMERKARR